MPFSWFALELPILLLCTYHLDRASIERNSDDQHNIFSTSSWSAAVLRVLVVSRVATHVLGVDFRFREATTAVPSTPGIKILRTMQVKHWPG